MKESDGNGSSTSVDGGGTGDGDDDGSSTDDTGDGSLPTTAKIQDSVKEELRQMRGLENVQVIQDLQDSVKRGQVIVRLIGFSLLLLSFLSVSSIQINNTFAGVDVDTSGDGRAAAYDMVKKELQRMVIALPALQMILQEENFHHYLKE